MNTTLTFGEKSQRAAGTSCSSLQILFLPAKRNSSLRLGLPLHGRETEVSIQLFEWNADEVELFARYSWRRRMLYFRTDG
jgi:hypothetical protein